MSDLAQDPQVDTPWVPEDTFGARLALIRNRKGWNIRQAALACGTSDHNWRAWEHGTIPRSLFKVASKIAEVSGCDYDWLLIGGPLAPRSRCLNGLPAELGQIPFAFDAAPPELAMAVGS